MGDPAGAATQLAALLQRPAVLTALGVALAPFLAGTPPATIDEGAARGRSRSKGGKGGGRPAQPPPTPPTAEQAMIASLQRQIASLEGVINTLRRELAESRGEPAPARTEAATAAQAASTTTAAKHQVASTTPAAAATGKAAAATSKAATAWQLAGPSHSRHSKSAQATQGATPPPPSPHVCGRVPARATGAGSTVTVPLPVRAPARPPLRLLAALLGAGGHQDGPEQYRALGHRRRRGGIRSRAPPPAGRPRSLDLCLGDAVRGAGLPAGRGAGSGGRWPHHSGAPPGAAHSGGPVGPAPLDDGGAAAPPLPGRVPGQDPGVGHRQGHAGSTPGGVEVALPGGSSAVRGVGGLHGSRGPPRGCGRTRGP